MSYIRASKRYHRCGKCISCSRLYTLVVNGLCAKGPYFLLIIDPNQGGCLDEEVVWMKCMELMKKKMKNTIRGPLGRYALNNLQGMSGWADVANPR